MWSRPTFLLKCDLQDSLITPISPLHRSQTDRAHSPREFLLSARGLLVNRCDTLAKQYGRVCETSNALVTAGEITQPTERGIVQSEQALVVRG
jgi:hypothetical protein